MLVDVNAPQYKQIEDFRKYARAICETFDVAVQMESSRAETDGRTIYLPNVMNMTTRELEMTYAILLHECGHIRYSSFDDAYFAALKSEWHAFLANSIEDARIENLLLKDYGGAKEIFETLYCDYTEDKKMMKRVFKHTGEEPSLFESVAFFVHNELCQFATPHLSTITKKHRRIARFWNEQQMGQLLEGHSLKTPQDVLHLTHEVYDRFFAHFKAKDTSKVLDYKKQLEKKTALEKMLTKLREEVEKTQAKLVEKTEFVREQEAALKKLESSQEEDRVKIAEEMESAKADIQEAMEKVGAFKNLTRTQSEYTEEQNRLTSQTRLLDQKKEEVRQVNERLANNVDGRGKQLTPEKASSMLAKRDEKVRIQQTHETRVKDTQERLDGLGKEVGKAYDEAVKAQTTNQVEAERWDERLQQRSERLAQLDQALKELNKAGETLRQSIEGARVDMQKAESDILQRVSAKMFDMEGLSKSGDFDTTFLPEMNYEDAWADAVSVQTEFDKAATKEKDQVVRNGQRTAGMFGSNCRDILTFIDKKDGEVSEIDVQAAFKDKIHASRFEDMNHIAPQQNRLDHSVVGVYGTRRPLIPMSTQFDVFKKETKSKDVSEYQNILAKNAVFYKNVERACQKAWKFSKKPVWKGGQEEGEFDTRSLWKLPTNQGDDFYEIISPKYENKMAAVILVDMSGSMSKAVSDKTNRARELAIGLSKGLSSIHVKHEVLGFHAPVSEELRQLQASNVYARKANRLEHVLVKEAMQKDQVGLMNLTPQLSDNSDGESLRFAMKRLKNLRSKEKVVIIISDGMPYLCDTDMSVLDEDLRSALEEAHKHKVKIMGFGFNEGLGEFMKSNFCYVQEDGDVIRFIEAQKMG